MIENRGLELGRNPIHPAAVGLHRPVQSHGVLRDHIARRRHVAARQCEFRVVDEFRALLATE
ncbi:MAG: hypothetical protein HUU20_02470 [Pirellulales bacterium]|nr:hypothetical protein [Pirellulales bacterium]